MKGDVVGDTYIDENGEKFKIIYRYRSCRKPKTVIYIRWHDGRFEFFKTLTGVFRKYTSNDIGLGLFTLQRMDLFKGYKSQNCQIFRSIVK